LLKQEYPVLLNAGIGAPSHASYAMDWFGADAVLLIRQLLLQKIHVGMA
jgi:thiazole synthase ThiGH ThiG subunit